MDTRLVWWNSKLIPESEARLSIYDSALMFGDMVFEMTRSFKGKHFKLREHLERLYRSIKYVRIPLQMTINEMEDACYEVSKVNEFEPDDEHRLMINVTRGLLSIYEQTGKPGPNFIISDFPLRWTTAGMGKLFDIGINLVIPSQRQIPAHLLDPKVKNRSRMHYLMANIEVSHSKEWINGRPNWALLLDHNGFVTEGPGYNFFIVKNRKLKTPKDNILKGISRAYVFRLDSPTAHGDLEPCYEDHIEPYDVYNADEAFVTATPFCMLPVTSLNGIEIGDGKPGPIYNENLSYWSRSVGVDIKSQIQAWDKGAVIGPSPYKFK